MGSFEEWLEHQEVDPNSQTPDALEQWKRIYDETRCRMTAGNEDDKFREWFFSLATQYYVAGRLAAIDGIVPVYGNLFHHAVEMYLKGALVGTLSVKQMRNPPYKHDLNALWDSFKAKEADPALHAFTPTIAALHEFDSIRYPEQIVAKGMMVNIVWAREDVAQVIGKATMPPKYEFVINDVDGLVIEILCRASRNPKALHPGVRSTARNALAYRNPHATDWGVVLDNR